MKLFTKKILDSLPGLDESAGLTIEQQKVWCKFFGARCTWYITAYDAAERLAFGFVNMGDSQMAELGYIPIQELESLRFPFGLSIERDIYFTPMPLKEVMDTIHAGGHV